MSAGRYPHKAGRDNEPEKNYRDQLNEQDFGEGTDEEHVSREEEPAGDRDRVTPGPVDEERLPN